MLLASMLAGCATSGPSGSVPVDLPALPPALTHCERPVALPTAALTQADVERFWARDRVALVKCGQSLAGVTAYYEDLRARLGTAK